MPTLPPRLQGASAVGGGLLIADGLVGIDASLHGRKRAGLGGGLMGIIVGLVFVMAGFGFLKPDIGDDWIKTQGEVVNTLSHTDNEGETTWTSQYSYKDTDGVEHVINGNMSSGRAEHLGKTAEVTYDPQDPQAGVVTSGLGAWVWLIFVGIGALTASGSLWTVVVRLLSAAPGASAPEGGPGGTSELGERP